MQTDTSAVKGMRGTLLAALLLALPGSLWAQAGPSSADAEGRVGSTAAVLVKGSTIAGKGRIQVGGWAGLVFGNRFAVGGGGLVLLEEVALAGSEAGSGFSLDFDYGGLFFRFWQPISPRLTGELGLVFGAGNAGVTDRLSGAELGSDNFLVAEPEVSLSFTLLPWVHIGVSGGYRLAWGVEDLPRVSEDELRAATGTISLRLGGR
jgi:hypothetical protein